MRVPRKIGRMTTDTLTRREVLGATLVGLPAIPVMMKTAPAQVPAEPARLADDGFWRTPAGVTRHYRQGRFGQLHYRLAVPPQWSAGEAPSKPPLLCFHLTPNSSRIYNRLLAEMGRDRLTIAVDTPGFGLSDPPPIKPGIEDYSACMGDFIVELAKEFGFEQVDLFGYHTGSKIALILARQQPVFVRRLVLVSAPVYTDEELAAQQRSLATPLADPWPADGEPLARRWQEHWRWRDPSAGEWFVQREVAEGLVNLEQAPIAYSAAFAVQHAKQLPLIEHPLLLICPADDLMTPTLRAKSLIRNGVFVERMNWSHGFLDVHTSECAALLREFLDGEADDRGRETHALVAPSAPTLAPTVTAGLSSPSIQRGFHAGPYGPLHYRLAHGPVNAIDSETLTRRPIVLLHMSPNSSRVFDALVSSLATSRPVLAIDTPGFGESEAPPRPIGIEQFAAANLQLIEALGFQEVDVLGYHTGAMTAIEMALIAPERVRRVVQISSPVFTAEEQDAARLQYRPRELKSDGTHLVEAWRNMQKYYTSDVPRSLIGRNFVTGLRGGPMSHWGHAAAFSYPLAERLPQVEQPVLIINPEDDLVNETRRAPRLLKHGRIYELPGRAHGFIDQMTAEFTHLLESFLDET